MPRFTKRKHGGCSATTNVKVHIPLEMQEWVLAHTEKRKATS